MVRPDDLASLNLPARETVRDGERKVVGFPFLAKGREGEKRHKDQGGAQVPAKTSFADGPHRRPGVGFGRVAGPGGETNRHIVHFGLIKQGMP